MTEIVHDHVAPQTHGLHLILTHQTLIHLCIVICGTSLKRRLISTTAKSSLMDLTARATDVNNREHLIS